MKTWREIKAKLREEQPEPDAAWMIEKEAYRRATGRELSNDFQDSFDFDDCLIEGEDEFFVPALTEYCRIEIENA